MRWSGPASPSAKHRMSVYSHLHTADRHNHNQSTMLKTMHAIYKLTGKYYKVR